MRHCKKKGRLSRRTSWRKATLKSLTKDLLTYQRIETTFVKAKALRVYVEPIITLARDKNDSVSARRRVFQKLCDKSVVKKLFDDLAPLFKDVPGGYTRIMALGTRKGDGAKMAIIELTKRTISDEELLGTIKEEKGLLKKKKQKVSKQGKAPEKAEEKEAAGKGRHVAPEMDAETKEERSVEDIKKEKARKEQKKITKRGIFKRFRRKSIG